MTINKLPMRYSELFYAITLLDLFLEMKIITGKQHNDHMRLIADSTLSKIQFIEHQADPDYKKEF